MNYSIPIRWGNSEMFWADTVRHHVLRRTNEQYLTVNGDMFFIWRQDGEGHMRIDSGNKVLKYILQVWDDVLDELPVLEYGEEGFFVTNGSSVQLGTTIQIIPEICYPAGLTLDKWMVKLRYKCDWECVRFPVYGKERVKMMQTFAKLDEPMVIKFDKWEFIPWK